MAISIPKFQGCCIIRSCTEFTQTQCHYAPPVSLFFVFAKRRYRRFKTITLSLETATVPCMHAYNTPLLALKISNRAQRVSPCATLNVSDPHHHFQVQALFHGHLSL